MASHVWLQLVETGANKTFVKSFSKIFKNGKTFIKATLTKFKTAQQKQIPRVNVDEQVVAQQISSSSLSTSRSRLLQSIFPKSSVRSLASEIRARYAFQLNTVRARDIRNVPLFSFVGLSLGIAPAYQHFDKKSVIEEMKEIFNGYSVKQNATEKEVGSLDDLEFGSIIAKGCNAAVYSAKLRDDNAADNITEEKSKQNDLAVKMMFNYDIESDAEQILRAMDKETVPLQMKNKDTGNCQPLRSERRPQIPYHPYVVDMQGAFVADTHDLGEGKQHYPAALPRHIHPEGFGRSQTLFLVMKRYTTTLREFVSRENVPMATRCLLLAQLLEGVAHLEHHGIAHRDLKTDNILVDLAEGDGKPSLALCDFGCCLAENSGKLKIPYTTGEVSKGGNQALMAPEIMLAKPGPRCELDYSRSDAWAVGAIAYEIFGMENPFYRSSRNREHLYSGKYKESDLPSLPDAVPLQIRKLVRQLLSRDPNMRPSASVATTMMHMILWDQKELKSSKRKAMTAKARNDMHDHDCLGNVDPLDWTLMAYMGTICSLALSAKRGQFDAETMMKYLHLKRVCQNDVEKACSFLKY